MEVRDAIQTASKMALPEREREREREIGIPAFVFDLPELGIGL